MTTVTVTRIDHRPEVALITLDQPGSAANILSDSLFDELENCFEGLQADPEIAGVILFSAKPKIFVAGADLNEIVATLDWPDEKIVQFCERGRRVMAYLSHMHCPTVAAIHGACVGGGLEITLYCDQRIASDDRRTVLGLPEVKLGLVPGWAGTVHLPRLAGIENALDLVTSARLVRANEANQMGFVDHVVPQSDLVERSLAAIDAMNQSDEFKDAREKMEIRTPDPVPDETKEELRSRFEAAIESNQAIFHSAPEIVLAHMLDSCDSSFDEASQSESQAMATVYGSLASYGLLNNFFLGEHNRKNPGHVDQSIAAEPINHVGIIGAGLMGTSIAANNLRRRKTVLLLDAAEDVANQSVQQLAGDGDAEAIKAITNYDDFKDCPLVIESVVETVEVKKIVLQQLESSIDDQTLIATNTSAIPISRMAEFLQRPNRFCGIHFCHPELMALVEVVRGPQTDEQTVASAAGYVRSLGKMPVVVRDSPGFVVNRLLAAMLDQSFRMFAEGHSIAAIDQAMREFGFQGGPFEIIDVIGADTCFYAGRTMWEAGLKCVTLSPILPKMVKTNWLGRKTGIGFYSYPDPQGDAQPNPELIPLIEGYQQHPPVAESDPTEIALKIMSAVVFEASQLLNEQVVADPRDIDLCIINGFSFPAHKGGILFWASQIGLERIVFALDEMAETEPRFGENESLHKMAEQGSAFY